MSIETFDAAFRSAVKSARTNVEIHGKLMPVLMIVGATDELYIVGLMDGNPRQYAPVVELLMRDRRAAAVVCVQQMAAVLGQWKAMTSVAVIYGVHCNGAKRMATYEIADRATKPCGAVIEAKLLQWIDDALAAVQ